ncbi:hypothetical protein PPERSA_05656 [Pseudocohnilembus persalinus]|uniref:Conserved oligomeric Golgi complex subunit 4 C-terminal domain-containing protein n=1 Tax=Pseudocohnilembus persalinus TaxID=266149 RepID=A0A0V0QQ33_PSEPJ|nr:hypothetical protein PPERSA_05656 [Pseudocohnilembus persalinus]|eukprot:KRX04395.1 hypothetical protein PPERSA_05656 [Pseudocohnilembus persalinus]
MIEDLEIYITKELKNLQEKQTNIESQLKNLQINSQNSENQQNTTEISNSPLTNDSQSIQKIADFFKNPKQKTTSQSQQNQENKNIKEILLQSKQSFLDLQEHSQKIKENVSNIQQISSETLKDFEKLKHRKVNSEKLLNTINAFLQFKSIQEALKVALQEKNIKNLIQQVKIYMEIEPFLIQDFISKEQAYNIKILMEQVQELQKDVFKEALAKNDQNLIVQCSQLQKILKIDDQALQKILDSYSVTLEKQFRQYEDEMFSTIPTNYNSDSQFFVQGHYKRPFLEYFIQILGQLWDTFEQYAQNIYQYYGIEGIQLMLKQFIDIVAGPVVKSLFKKMNNFYMLDKQQNLNKQEQIDLLYTYLEEVSQISTQSENFIMEVTQVIEELEQGNKESFRNQLEQMAIQVNVLLLLGNYIQYVEQYLKLKMVQILEQSDSYKALVNFNRQFFNQFLDKEEQLINITELCQFIDEIFFIIKHILILTLETLHKSSICAVIQRVSSNILNEQFIGILFQLLQQYLKKDYFNQASICFTSKYKAHNTLMIILFNNLEMAMKFQKKLSQALNTELKEIFTEEDQQTIIKSITYCIDEMQEQNQQKLSQIINQQMDEFTQYMNLTLKEQFDEFKKINFQVNESQLQQYESQDTFSKTFKVLVKKYLEQWKTQLTKDNFDIFITNLLKHIAKEFEQIIFKKKFLQLGGILLDKEIRSLIPFFQNITEANIKPIFKKLILISEILMLENRQDIEEFIQINLDTKNQIITQEEINAVIKLRIDFSFQ